MGSKVSYIHLRFNKTKQSPFRIVLAHFTHFTCEIPTTRRTDSRPSRQARVQEGVKCRRAATAEASNKAAGEKKKLNAEGSGFQEGLLEEGFKLSRNIIIYVKFFFSVSLFFFQPAPRSTL